MHVEKGAARCAAKLISGSVISFHVNRFTIMPVAQAKAMVNRM